MKNITRQKRSWWGINGFVRVPQNLEGPSGDWGWGGGALGFVTCGGSVTEVRPTKVCRPVYAQSACVRCAFLWFIWVWALRRGDLFGRPKVKRRGGGGRGWERAARVLVVLAGTE